MADFHEYIFHIHSFFLKTFHGDLLFHQGGQDLNDLRLLAIKVEVDMGGFCVVKVADFGEFGENLGHSWVRGQEVYGNDDARLHTASDFLNFSSGFEFAFFNDANGGAETFHLRENMGRNQNGAAFCRQGFEDFPQFDS